MDAIILTHAEAEEIAAVARELHDLESIRRLLDESRQYDVGCVERTVDNRLRPRKNTDEAVTVR
ncbi:hypothetical protein [Intestinimonas butyriciproducens]|uniref:hypothetical protein n=1 Tax=Intestinimonas butyriciproducens TaxID=1297617 RepID=UPI0031B56A2D